MNIWQRLQSLFDKEARRPASPPFLHTSIDLPIVDDHTLDVWQNSARRSLLYGQVVSAYKQYLSGLPAISNSVQFVKNDGIDGLVLYCKDQPEIKHTDYLCMLQEQMMTLQSKRYVKNLGDIRSQEVNGAIGKTHRIYLKPSIYLWEGGKGQQLYGNTTLEYKTLDGTAHQYKITANTYQDHKYYPPEDFSELVDLLWKV